jgi:iron complex outermembrane receptor protein
MSQRGYDRHANRTPTCPAVGHGVIAALTLCLASRGYAAPVTFHLPTQSLADSISQFSSITGLSVSVDATLLDARIAPAIEGDLEPVEALSRLLDGTGLSVKVQGDRAVITDAAVDTQTETVVVVGPGNGSADVGYRTDTAKTTGPWGDKAVLDTPYSISSTPAELMENWNASSTDAALGHSPVASESGNGTAGAGGGYVATSVRGFTTTEVSRDGIPMRWSWFSTSIEDLDRIEILTGLSGFLYGAANVGGTIDEVTKRPTTERFTELTVGNFGERQYYVHADLGGPVDTQGRFGYRINAFATDGGTPIAGQSIRRTLFSGAFDWRPVPELLLQLDASQQSYHVDKPNQSVLIWGLAAYPPASTWDNHQSYTYDWAYYDLKSDRVGAGLAWDVSESLTLRGHCIYFVEDRSQKDASLWLDGQNGVYVDYHMGNLSDTNTGAYLYLDWKFKIFGSANKLTVGGNTSGYRELYPVQGYYFREDYYANSNVATVLQAPDITTWPTTYNGVPYYTSNKNRYDDLIIGEDLTINPQWSLLLGFNHARISTKTFGADGSTTAQFGKSADTPTVSIIYKPLFFLSTYATYMQALEAAQVVPLGASPPYTNAGDVLPPTVSHQIEIGTKADLGGTLLTAALYRIVKANVYTTYNGDGTATLDQDGRETHQGIELTATGTVFDSLTLFGGASFLDGKITRTNNAALAGGPPTNAPKSKAAMYAEYRLPFVEPRLYLTGGVSYTGHVDYVPNLLTTRETLPTYTLFDAGLRFEAHVDERPVTARMNVSNIADKHYLAGGALGSPRTVSFSVSTKF